MTTDNESEERFSEIAEEALLQADLVKCSFSDFIEGLKTIEAAIRSRRKGAEEESR